MSIEVIARLSAYPKMEELLDSLPPKLIALSAEQPAEPVAWDRAAHAGGRHVEHAVTCIQEAFFTGKGDKPTVIDLYKKFVSEIVTALQKTLAVLSQSEQSDGGAAGGGAPTLAAPLPAQIPPALPVRFSLAPAVPRGFRSQPAIAWMATMRPSAPGANFTSFGTTYPKSSFGCAE